MICHQSHFANIYCFPEIRNFNNVSEGRRNNEFFNFIFCSFLQLKFLSVVCWFVSFSISFLSMLRFEICLAQGIECIWRWMCDGISSCTVLRCFLSQRCGFERGKRFVHFMYSGYVISSFLITHLEKILFRFLGAAVFGGIINCISRGRMKIREEKSSADCLPRTRK